MGGRRRGVGSCAEPDERDLRRRDDLVNGCCLFVLRDVLVLAAATRRTAVAGDPARFREGQAPGWEVLRIAHRMLGNGTGVAAGNVVATRDARDGMTADWVGRVTVTADLELGLVQHLVCSDRVRVDDARA